jgi:hypothetical protein
MVMARRGTALHARLLVAVDKELLIRLLQGSRFLEAPMATLFHDRAPRLRWPNPISLPAPRHSGGVATRVRRVADEFDPSAMVTRFQERARAVKNRGIPPIEGPERQRFVDRMQVDYQDFAMLGDAVATLEDGVLTLRVDLRPR